MSLTMVSCATVCCRVLPCAARCILPHARRITCNGYGEKENRRYAHMLAQKNVVAFVHEEHQFTERLFMFYARIRDGKLPGFTISESTEHWPRKRNCSRVFVHAVGTPCTNPTCCRTRNSSNVWPGWRCCPFPNRIWTKTTRNRNTKFMGFLAGAVPVMA